MSATHRSHTTNAASSSLPAYLRSLSLAERELYDRIPEEMDYVDHESFAKAETEDELYGDAARDIDVPVWTNFPEVVDDVVPTSARRTTLGAKEEALLFRKYNYACFRLQQLIEAQAKRRTAGRVKAMILWYERALTARASLVRANMALVLAMAKRTRIPNVEFTELVSEGNMALLRSVEKFDVSRGFKFSTYACRAILKSFNRLATKTGRYRQHFPTEFDPDLERSDYDVKRHEMQQDDSVESLREILSRNTANLSDIERTVVMERFAIASGGKKKTLAAVGKMVGLTNERVRQIQNLALAKLRAAMDRDFVSV